MEPTFINMPRIFLSEGALMELSEGKGWSDHEKMAVINLLMNNAMEMINACRERTFCRLDPLSGNFGCQMNTKAIIAIVTSPSIDQEIDLLSAFVEKAKIDLQTLLKATVKDRRGKPKPKQIIEGLNTLFKERISTISVSPAMAYLLQAHLLTCTKVPTANSEKNDLSKLDVLANGKEIKVPDEVKKFLLSKAQHDLCLSAIRAVSEEDCRRSLSSEEAARMKGALEIIRQNVPEPGKLPKSYVCQFYSMKAVLAFLRERKIPIVVKKWLKRPDDAPMMPFFLRSESPQGPFKRIADEEMEKQLMDTPCAVFEWEINNQLDRDQVMERFAKITFENAVLIDTAQENQFEYGTPGLEYLTDPEARKEIEAFAQKGSEIDSVKGKKDSAFWLDHVFCSTLKEEWKGGRK